MGLANPFGTRPAQAAAAAQPGSPPASRQKSHLDLLQLTVATLMWFVSARKMPYPAGIPGGTEPRARKKIRTEATFRRGFDWPSEKSVMHIFSSGTSHGVHATLRAPRYESLGLSEIVPSLRLPTPLWTHSSVGWLCWAFSSSVRLSVSRSAYSSVCHHTYNSGEAEDVRAVMNN